MSDEPFGWPVPEEPAGLTRATRLEILSSGEIEIVGRMPWSSNGTFLLTVTADGVTVPAISKPKAGERPLWDFPDGSLYRREVATHAVSAAAGWDIVPDTVERDSPLGVGMVQRFVHHDPEENYFTLLPNHVERMREFAILDVLVNNADRKGGHCLRDPATDTVFGIDHGLTFHAQWKLRTVIWDFANEALTDDETDAVRRVLNDESLDEHLHALLNRFEVDAFRIRGEALLAEQLPEPEDGHYSFPWPLV